MAARAAHLDGRRSAAGNSHELENPLASSRRGRPAKTAWWGRSAAAGEVSASWTAMRKAQSSSEHSRFQHGQDAEAPPDLRISAWMSSSRRWRRPPTPCSPAPSAEPALEPVTVSGAAPDACRPGQPLGRGQVHAEGGNRSMMKSRRQGQTCSSGQRPGHQRRGRGQIFTLFQENSRVSHRSRDWPGLAISGSRGNGGGTIAAAEQHWARFP